MRVALPFLINQNIIIMAISRNGGTRSRLRGRVGSEIYTKGKDAFGKSQQIVKAMPEKVENPQSASQMKTRMIMATVQQAKSSMAIIIDHSFDKVKTPIANLSRFVSLNAKLVRADLDEHPSEDNQFGLNAYKEKGIKMGAWLISEGYAAAPIFDADAQAQGKYIFDFDAAQWTLADIMSRLGMYSADYLTFCAISNGGDFLFCRYRFNPAIPADTIATADNISSFFLTEGNIKFAVSVAGEGLVFDMSPAIECHGVIKSVKTRSGYNHSTCQMYCVGNVARPASEAFPSYPVGKVNYLNGGDIAGMSESGGDEPPAPVAVDPVLTMLKFNGWDILDPSKYAGMGDKDFWMRWEYENVPINEGFNLVVEPRNREYAVGDTINESYYTVVVPLTSDETSYEGRAQSYNNRVYLCKDMVVVSVYGYTEE